MDNQQGSSEEENPQRPFRKEVGGKPHRSGVLVITMQNDYDEDMVCALWKHRGYITSAGSSAPKKYFLNHRYYTKEEV